jgi:hypothetical protein
MAALCILVSLAFGIRSFATGPDRSVVKLPIPLQFIENAGQWDAEVRFGVFRGMEKAAFTREGMTLFRPMHRPATLPRISETDRSATMRMDAGPLLERVELDFLRPSAGMRLRACGLTGRSTNIYHGADSSSWRSGLATYRTIRYDDVWNGVHVEFTERNGRLLRRIIAEPGADTRAIGFIAKGAVEPDVTAFLEQGDASGERIPVAIDVQVSGDTMRVKSYRNFFEKRLVIETEFNTFFGGNGYDGYTGMEIDEEGNLYVALITASTDLSIAHSWQDRNRGGTTITDYSMPWDYYLASFAPGVRSLRWSTYFGGSGTEVETHFGSRGSMKHDFAPKTPQPSLMGVGREGIYFLCISESMDFPITTNAFQKTRPWSDWYYTSTALARFDQNGKLMACTWLGDPTWYGGAALALDDSSNVFVWGITSGEQSFVPRGAIEDSMRVKSSHKDTIITTSALVKFSPSLDRVLAGTYLFPQPDRIGGYRTEYLMKVTHDGGTVFAIGLDTEYPPPVIRGWQNPEGSKDILLCKLDRNLRRYIFTTWMGCTAASVSDLTIDDNGYVILAGFYSGIRFELPLHKPISDPSIPLQHSQRRFLAKFPPDGGEPIFVTWLPWPEGPGGSSTGVSIEALYCDEILVFGSTGSSVFPFTNAEDTLRSVIRNTNPPFFMLVLDSQGQSIRYASYWHPDTWYPMQSTPALQKSNLIRDTGGLGGLCFPSLVFNNQLYIVAATDSLQQDSLTTFNAFQPLHSGDKVDLALVRTRVPGCTLLSCSIDMADTVTISGAPGIVFPEYLNVEVEVSNVDPALSANGIECVLTLPPGLLPHPGTQSLRQSYGNGTLAPGQSAHFSWKVRVDTAALADSALWIDAVTYYRDAEFTSPDPPSASPCDHFLRIVRVGRFEPLLDCTVEVPDSIVALGGGDGYAPDPWPVRFAVGNAGTAPAAFGRFTLDFGGNIGGAAVPPSDRYHPGVVLDPGGSHTTTWQARARRRAEDRTMQVIVTGEDADGNILTYCTDEIFVPGLASPLCGTLAIPRVRIDGVTGTPDRDTVVASVVMRQVLDTTLYDCFAEIDVSACRHLQLYAGEQAGQGPVVLRADERDTLTWHLRLASAPAATVRDTIAFHLRSGGRQQSDCLVIVEIMPMTEQLDCAIQGPDQLGEAEVLAGLPFTIDARLSNTGTLPLTLGRVEMHAAAAAEVTGLDAAARAGGTLAAGSDRSEAWRFRSRILRASRMARFEVTAYDASDNILAACAHEVSIAGIDGLRCAIAAPDSVRFDRDSVRYRPDPLPVTVDLRNLLDTEETAIEAEIDTSNAPRFTLAPGEVLRKTLAKLDSHATARFTWLLAPLKAPNAEYQDIRVRYRSAEQGSWKECDASVFIEAWPEIAELRCTTGGHDSLFADPFHEMIIPVPFEVSYTITNTGTIPLTNCQAAIVLPAGFALAGSDSIQSFGNLDPGAAGVRWWTLRTTDEPAGFGPHAIDWIWTSDAQGSIAGCSHTVQVVPGPSSGIEVTPLHLRFEAEMDGALPPAQTVKLWTGNGLAMPWAVQSDTWYIDADPVLGDHAADIAVRPNTTALGRGSHASTLEIGGLAPNTPKRIAVEYVIWSLTGTDDIRSPEAHRIGSVYPHPVPMDGEATIVLDVPPGTAVRLTLVDLLGRERAVLYDAAASGGASVTLSPSRLHLSPGVYLLRLTSGQHTASRLVAVVR